MEDQSTEQKSIVAEWYKGKSIFVTGGTGYMGKVLLEKIVYVCENIETVYVLMRPKRDKSQQERLEAIFALPLFERIRATNPKVLHKIVPINGTITGEDLDICAEDRKKLIENVSIVFHFAATVRLESELPEALDVNTVGTQRVISLCREMKNLVALVHVSTAFCSADIDVFEEKVYDSDDPNKVIRTAKWMSREALIKATPELIKPHNTYTYTKRLAENLIAKEAKNMRVAIVRPSIVTPVALSPLPGWVDSLNGPPGIIAAASKGVLRVMHCDAENIVHIIPVDLAINATIVIAWKLGSAARQPAEIPVYNLTNAEVIRYTWSDVLTLSKQIGYEYPFEWQVWYPGGDICSSYQMYFIWSILLHWIPAIFLDALLFLFRQERIMIRVQKKIYNGIELLRFFTTRNWIFKSQNFLNLKNELNAVDNEIFTMDYFKMPIDKYLSIMILGTRQYCLKENVKSLTRCRIKQKILFVVDKLFKFFLLYGIFCLSMQVFRYFQML